NPVAGIIKMPYRKFLFWNVFSALVWTEGFIWSGYFLGEKMKGSVDKYILPIVAVIVILSVAPLAWEIFKEWRTRKHLS
ncbi:MAG: DedA family protein, partial [Actinomycetes bacterium]